MYLQRPMAKNKNKTIEMTMKHQSHFTFKAMLVSIKVRCFGMLGTSFSNTNVSTRF